MATYSGSDGSMLHFDEVTGVDSSAVILLGGGPGRHPMYLRALGGLLGDHRFIFPHLRSVGASPAPSDPRLGSFWAQASDLDALRDHLQLETITVVAHSAGTRIATAYAAQFPDRVERMLLITPPAAALVTVESDVGDIRERRSGESAFDQALAALAVGPHADDDTEMTAWGQTIGAVGYAAWGPVEQEHARLGSWSRRAAADFGSEQAPADLAIRLSQVSAPVLVVAGAEDALTGMKPVVAVAGLFTNGSAVVLEHAGHYPWVERPQEFAAAVRSFMTTE